MNPTLKRAIRRMLPRALKPHRIRGGLLRNYQIVTSWHDYPAAILGRTEQPLLEWFAANVHDGETWLDVGAHYGYTALALAHFVGAQGRVFAFEPMLTSAGCVAHTRRLNELAQLTIVPLALNQASDLELAHLPVVRGMMDSTLNQTAEKPLWQEPLLGIGFDSVWRALCGGDARVHGIKIDVQGMELAVLRGMKKLLQTQNPKLVVELHIGVSREELCAFMQEVGYTRPAVAIEPAPDETVPQFRDDKSYAFVV
jgi:FkbM family methyltransferase